MGLDHDRLEYLRYERFTQCARAPFGDEHANFRTLDVALNSLFRFSTGENWNGFMYEVAHGPDADTWEPASSFASPVVFQQLHRQLEEVMRRASVGE